MVPNQEKNWRKVSADLFRCTAAIKMTHDQSKVVSRRMNEITLGDVLQAPQGVKP